MKIQELLDTLTGYLKDFAPRLLGAVLMLILGFWLIRKLARGLARMMDRSKVDDNLRPFLRSLITISLKVLLMFSAAGVLGFETSSFVAVIAAAGFAVGMALQGSLSNFAGGILIMLFKPYKRGDFIAAQGIQGHVKEIQIFNTVVMTLDHRYVIIPNSLMANGIVENQTRDPHRRVTIHLQFPMEENLDAAREIIREILSRHQLIAPKKPIDLPISSLKNGIAVVDIEYWVASAAFDGADEFVNEELKKAIDAGKLRIISTPLYEM